MCMCPHMCVHTGHMDVWRSEGNLLVLFYYMDST